MHLQHLWPRVRRRVITDVTTGKVLDDRMNEIAEAPNSDDVEIEIAIPRLDPNAKDWNVVLNVDQFLNSKKLVMALSQLHVSRLYVISTS